MFGYKGIFDDAKEYPTQNQVRCTIKHLCKVFLIILDYQTRVYAV